MLKIIRFFDKLEDRVRGVLSHHPVLYSLIGGTALVLFWEGISKIVDSVPFLNSLAGGFLLTMVSLATLLLIGVFVSFFIGDTILMSGINKEKKIAEQTEEEIEIEAHMMHNMNRKIVEIEEIVKDLRTKIK